MLGQSVARCPHCRYPFAVDADRLGTEATCDKCRNVFTMTADDSAGRIKPRPRIPGERVLMRARLLHEPAPGTVTTASLLSDEDDANVSLAELAELAPTRQPPPRAATPAPPPLPSWAGAMPGQPRRPAAAPNGAKRFWMIGAAAAVVMLTVGAGVVKVAKNRTAWGTGTPAVSPPSGPAPKMSLHVDAAGRHVGDLTIRGRRSASTDVRLVLPPGQHANGSLPCVFVAPAGSNLLVGVPFGPGEREDFYPLLDRGVAVCFYSLDGTVPDLQNATERQLLSAIEPYMKSDGGMANLSDAIDTALASAPQIDPARLGAAGHSSAGTIAIMAAAREPRIHAVAAMAPATDLPKRLAEVARSDRRLDSFIRQVSPSELASVPSPVWIYHTNDDENVPIKETWEFKLKHGANVSVRATPTGGHGGAYHHGLPEAVDFLATTLKARPPLQHTRVQNP